jgi:transposase
MIVDFSRVNIYVYPGAVDMRKQINGLAVLVEEELGSDPFSGNLFLFCNHRRSHLKILFWDRNGFWLALKRLEGRDRFPWPREAEEARRISTDELAMLLSGIDFWRAHKPLSYSRTT